MDLEAAMIFVITNGDEINRFNATKRIMRELYERILAPQYTFWRNAYFELQKIGVHTWNEPTVNRVVEIYNERLWLQTAKRLKSQLWCIHFDDLQPLLLGWHSGYLSIVGAKHERQLHEDPYCLHKKSLAANCITLVGKNGVTAYCATTIHRSK